MTVKGSIVTDPTTGPDAAAPFLRLPDRATLHTRRAARFVHLAVSSPMGGYLRFLAGVADAQGAALAGMPAPPAVDEKRLQRLLDHGMPFHGRTDTVRGDAWRLVLDTMLGDLATVAMPPAARRALDQVAGMDAAGREALAARVLGDSLAADDLAPALFVGAALQVYWIWLGAGIDPAPLAPMRPEWLCPLCGSPPLVSLIDAPGLPGRSRYLHCSLCEADWRYTRARCADCGANEGIAYHGLEGPEGKGIESPARAETCDRCKTYVKILACEQDPGLDPVADDLATTGLDIKVAEAGWRRNAASPFLLAG
jgi:FdhE protein